MKTWDESYSSVIQILESEIAKIAQDFIGEPNTIDNQELIRSRMMHLAKQLGYTDMLQRLNLSVDFNTSSVKAQYVGRQRIDSSNIDKHLDVLVDKAQERVIEYIQEHYDKYDVQEHQSYMYQIITDKSYDIIIALLDEDYEVNDNDFDSIVEQIQGELDFAEFYEVVDDILHTAMTMEEKLAEVGMSYRDFI